MASFFVHSCFNVAGKGLVIVGQVKEGAIQVGQSSIFLGKSYKLSGILLKNDKVTSALTGQMVGLTFESLNDKQAIQSRQMLILE